MISIIIPVYNQADKLKACLQSIRRQTYEYYEVIVVNDGSKDGSAAVAEANGLGLGYRFELISQENKGANAARNTGARNAKGEFLLFCDADLILEPPLLTSMLDALNSNPQASYAYSSFRYGRKIFKLWPFDTDRLLEMPYIHTSSLIRTDSFPGFDEDIKRLQDWDLWLTMLEKRQIGVWIDQILFTVQPGGSMSKWLPKFAYKAFPFLPSVKKYRQAVAAVKRKHNI